MRTKRIKTSLVLLGSLLTGSCIGQTIKYEDMKTGNVQIPVMGQYLNGLNVLMEKNPEKTVCLTSAYKGEGIEFSPFNGEFNPVITYELRYESHLYQSFVSVTDEFILEEDGRYRIMESGYVNSVAHRQSENDMWTEDPRLTPPQPSKPQLVGYSDDTALLAVRVLKYIYENSVEPAIYNEKQVDRPPLFISSGNTFITSDTEREIEKWLHNPPEYYLGKLTLKGIRGRIKLSYLINEYGQACHVKVEQVKINKPESMSDICREINAVLKGIKWESAQLNDKPVAVRRDIVIKI